MPITWIVIGILVLIIGTIIASGFVSASPGQIKVVSGPWGQRTIHGKTGWKIPLIERVDVMTASMISVDVRTADFVPTNNYINIKVDAAVKVRIGIDKEELFKAATRNFLYKDTSEIADEVRDTLEGHLRAIIGQMKLEDIVTNRAVFSENVQANATKDLEEMGLEIVAFNIQGLSDANGVIDNLGVSNIYERSGFILDGITPPNYVWVQRNTFDCKTRYETTKKKLVREGFDSNLSEIEIMRNRNYYRVYDAGSLRYIKKL